MKRLDIEYKLNGSTLKLFRRSEKVACFKQFIDDQLVAYELFEIKSRKKETIKGVEYPEREVYAANSDWGVTAWSLRASLTEKEVVDRFEKLEREVDGN